MEIKGEQIFLKSCDQFIKERECVIYQPSYRSKEFWGSIPQKDSNFFFLCLTLETRQKNTPFVISLLKLTIFPAPLTNHAQDCTQLIAIAEILFKYLLMVNQLVNWCWPVQFLNQSTMNTGIVIQHMIHPLVVGLFILCCLLFLSFVKKRIKFPPSSLEVVQTWHWSSVV